MTAIQLAHALAFLDIAKRDYAKQIRVTESTLDRNPNRWIRLDILKRLEAKGLLPAWDHYVANGGATGPALRRRTSGRPTRETQAEIERRKMLRQALVKKQGVPIY